MPVYKRVPHRSIGCISVWKSTAKLECSNREQFISHCRICNSRWAARKAGCPSLFSRGGNEADGHMQAQGEPRQILQIFDMRLAGPFHTRWSSFSIRNTRHAKKRLTLSCRDIPPCWISVVDSWNDPNLCATSCLQEHGFGACELRNCVLRARRSETDEEFGSVFVWLDTILRNQWPLEEKRFPDWGANSRLLYARGNPRCFRSSPQSSILHPSQYAEFPMEDDTLVHIKALQALMGENTGLSATYCAHSTIIWRFIFHVFLPLHQGNIPSHI